MCAIVDEARKAIEISRKNNQQMISMIMDSRLENVEFGEKDKFTDTPKGALIRGNMQLMSLEGSKDTLIVKIYPGAESPIHRHTRVEAFQAISNETYYIIAEDEAMTKIIKQGVIGFGDPPVIIQENQWHVILSSKNVSYVALKIN